jgi:hypothetical protein
LEFGALAPGAAAGGFVADEGITFSAFTIGFGTGEPCLGKGGSDERGVNGFFLCGTELAGPVIVSANFCASEPGTEHGSGSPGLGEGAAGLGFSLSGFMKKLKLPVSLFTATPSLMPWVFRSMTKRGCGCGGLEGLLAADWGADDGSDAEGVEQRRTARKENAWAAEARSAARLILTKVSLEP